MPLLTLGLVLKITIVLVLAWLTTALCDRASAATRHLIWAAALGLVLLLPVWPRFQGAPTTTISIPVASTTRTVVTVTAAAPLSPIQAGFYLYVFVAAGLMLRLLRAHIAAWRLKRAGETNPIGFLSHPSLEVPLVVGVFRPVILLPASSASWMPERLGAVLAHERMHIARGDTFWQLLANLACVFYWPHPLVWLAARRLHQESEAAADNGALTTGILPSDYAGHLVAIAAAIPNAANPSAKRTQTLEIGGLAMANVHSLPQRVSALLHPKTNRSGLQLRFVALTVVFAATLAVGIQGLSLQAQQNESALQGMVTSPGGDPIASARVALAFNGISSSLADRKEVVLSNAAGEFRFSPIPPGAYSLSVGKEGMANLEMTAIGVQPGKTTSLRVTLPEAGSDSLLPPSPDQRSRAIRVGGNVQASKLISKVPPLYPADAKADRVQGVVLFSANIGPDGAVTSMKQLNQLVDPRLVDAASTAVRQWRYQPTLLNGNPVEVVTEIQVNFTLLP